MKLFPAKQLLKRQLQLCVADEGERAACVIPFQNLGQTLRDYLQCRQFQQHETEFASKVKQLQAWQAQRVRHTHAECMHHPLHQRAAQFVLLDAYEQLDMLSLAPQLMRIVRYAERLFPQPLLRIADLSLAINALTAQLDQAIAEELFEQMGVVNVLEADYIQAFLAVDGVACRRQQLSLMVELVHALNRQANNSMVLMAFKLAKAPAYAAGFQSLYSFMANGLDVLRSLPNAVLVVEQIVSVELTLNDAIANGNASALLLQA
jgi:hypothetical protein